MLVVIAMLVTPPVAAYKAYQGRVWVNTEVDDGVSAFEGAELVAASQALRAADACVVHPEALGRIFGASALKVTGVELTGGTFPSGAPRTTEFRAKVQGYTSSFSGISTQEIAVWTENYLVRPRGSWDCRAPDW